jgi:protein-S-isoprenylcysteine O-methyltransferase Ste14
MAMSAVASWMTAARGLSVRTVRPGNMLPALVWGFLLYNQIVNTAFPPALPRVLVVLIASCIVVLFLARRDPVRKGSSWEMAIALLGTFIVALLEGPTTSGTNLEATVIQVIGLFGWLWALVSLGQSFGLAPADRGLKQDGPYRFVRHPMYASEMVFFLGYLIAVPTWRSALIIGALFVLQVIRLLREERILAGYSEYRSRVRWRLVPGIW